MSTVATHSHLLLSTTPVSHLDEYVAAGGGEALRAARERGPDGVIDELVRSGLQGRGGAGFPAGRKWSSVRRHPCSTRYVVCNAAEGEPGTFKDRWLLRNHPYQVLEGVAVAAYAVSASGAFVACKSSFQPEIAALERARVEMSAAGLLGDVPVEVVAGPEDYLFGEEKALLEVIEGNLALPRILPPYQVGLFAAAGASNPTLMNNAETLAAVTSIQRRGAAWFRSEGTSSCPGTMLFTICGDVQRPGVYELPLGLPLRHLVEDVAGGPPEGRRVKAVVPGASSAVLTGGQLDVALAFDTLRDAGSGLGSAGFVVYDESACAVAVTEVFSRFLAVESCGQCPACKQGAINITERLERLERGDGSQEDLDRILARCRSVTGGSRCALPTGESLLVGSALEAFGDEFTAHLAGGCPRPRQLPIPKLADYDENAGVFVYADQSVYERGDADGDASGD